MPITEQLEALNTGTLQIGFMVAGGLPVPESPDHIEIARSPIRVVMARGHRLARSKRISMAQLLEEHLLCVVARKVYLSVHRDIMLRTFAARGIKVKPIQQVDWADAFSATLASWLGVSLVAESGTLAHSREPVIRPLAETAADISLGLVALWRKDQNSQLVANFVEVMRKITPLRSARS